LEKIVDKNLQQYFVFANSGGCPQNQLDGSRLCAYLDGNGYMQTEEPGEADLLFINSCSYRSEKENESFSAIREFSKGAKKNARIFVTGCLPKIAPDKIAFLDNKFIIIPGTELNAIEKHIAPAMVSWDDSEVNRIKIGLFSYQKPFRRYLARAVGAFRCRLPRVLRHHFDALFMYDHSEKSFIVRISEGCLGQCAYCAIRFSRGKLRSKPVASIVNEVRAGVDAGIDELLLTATELAAYGRDINTDLSVLLKEIVSMPGDFDLLLFYANPRWLIDSWKKLEPLFASGRIHFVHLSLNGTSDDVLRAMGRGYTLAEFENLVRAIRRISPTTVLQTQVIVGFPGETDKDFKSVRSFFKRTYLHNIQVHAYDQRPGTPAASMSDQVPYAVRRKRRAILYRQTLFAKIRFNSVYIVSFLLPFMRKYI
jgi:MiaB/RimO family radical SAM methylthiotransferase